MTPSTHVKPITHLKAHSAELMRQMQIDREPVFITQNGEARMVLQDVTSWEETQASLALLKILALGQRQIEAGRVEPASDVFARLRERK